MCTYRRQLISTRGTSTVSGAEEESERSTILCNIYPSCLLIYLALYPVPSYGPLPPLLRPPRSTLFTAGTYSIYRPTPLLRLFFLSSTACSFYQRTIFSSLLVWSTRHIYRLIRPPARPFVYFAITIVDRYDVGYTPRR